MKMCPCGEQTLNPSGVCSLCQSDAGLFASLQKREKPMLFNPNLSVPEEISRKALELKAWMETHGAQSIYGMGDVTELQRQLVAARATIQNIRDQLENAR